jgi:hypothetical protein
MVQPIANGATSRFMVGSRICRPAGFSRQRLDTVHARRPILFRFRGRLSALDGRPCWHMVTGGPRANDKRGVIDSLKAMRDA